MSSFLCFVCHSTVNADTNEDTREKYREVIGMNLCPDSHLCFICCYFLNKMCMFKSICLKRSLEYPVLFSEKGTINLQRSDITVAILCPEDVCIQHRNTRYHFYNYSENSQSDFDDSNYCELQDDRNFEMSDNLTKQEPIEDFHNEDYLFTSKDNVEDNMFDEQLILPNLEPTRITQNDLVNAEWFKNDSKRDKKRNDAVLLELHNSKNAMTVEENEVYNNLCTQTQVQRANIENEIITTALENNTNKFVEVKNIVNDIADIGNSIVNIETSNIDIDNMVENSLVESEIDNQLHAQETQNEELTKTKKSRSKKKEFEMIKLSIKEQKMELEQARKDEKFKSGSFKCFSCAMTFHFKDTYQAHMMRHEESNGEYRCATCSLRFANPAVLRSHAANHSVRYKCTRCSEAVRARQRPTHARLCAGREQDGDSIACHLCGHEFLTVKHFQQHMQRYHKSKSSNRTFLCNVCGKSFSNRPAVRTHMITHINKKFECDKCSSTFSSPYTLNNHKKKHTEHELHYCGACKVAFSSRKSLVAHRRNALAHKESVYKCEVCARACPSLRSLHAHTAAVHARTKHLACDMCPARYSTTKALRSHMLCHKAEVTKRTPLCHACGEKFKSTAILKRHLKNVCEKDKIEEEFY